MIEASIISYVLILTRVGAFVSALPVLGGATVPRLVKIGLAMALAVFHFKPAEGVGNPAILAQTDLTWLACGLLLSRELVLGALLGYALGLVLLPIKIAGHYLGQEMGLALGQLSSPTSPDSSTVVSAVFEALATLLLLGLDGHHLFLAALHGTFVRFPIGTPFGPPPMTDLVTGLARAQEWGLLLAAPLGAALFLTSVVLALLSRAVPRMNLFSVGFSLRVIVGLGGALVLLPEFVHSAVNVLGRFGELLK